MYPPQPLQGCMSLHFEFIVRRSVESSVWLSYFVEQDYGDFSSERRYGELTACCTATICFLIVLPTFWNVCSAQDGVLTFIFWTCISTETKLSAGSLTKISKLLFDFLPSAFTRFPLHSFLLCNRFYPFAFFLPQRKVCCVTVQLNRSTESQSSAHSISCRYMIKLGFVWSFFLVNCETDYRKVAMAYRSEWVVFTK